MSFYYSFRQRLRRQSRRAKALELLSITLIVAAILGIIWFIWLRTMPSEDSRAPEATEVITSTFASEEEKFETEYFSFRTPKGWKYIEEESGAGMYVYRGFNSTNVEQDLTIYVNNSVSIPKTARVMAVRTSAAGLIAEGSVSDHCGKSVQGTRRPVEIKVSSVTLLCDTDGTIFSVLVGEKDGTGAISLARPGGERATYTVLYRDLTANPVGRDLSKIVQTFETK